MYERDTPLEELIVKNTDDLWGIAINIELGLVHDKQCTPKAYGYMLKVHKGYSRLKYNMSHNNTFATQNRIVKVV